MAIVAFLVGVLPNLPGFLRTVAPERFAGVGEPWTTIYTYAWFAGTGLALVTYRALTRTR